MSASTERLRGLLASRERLALLAAVVLALAFGLRLTHVLDTPYRPVYDARSYLSLAEQIARTGDYSTSRAPGHGAGGTRGPSAYFPPAYPYLLAAVDLLDGHRDTSAAAVHGARIAQVLLGTLVVGLIGLIALELFGPGAALLAAALAAVYPVLIEMTGLLVSENLMSALVLAALYLCLRARSGAVRWLAAAGVCAGLSALAHENAVVCLAPLAYGAARLGGRRALAAFLLPAILTLLPWTVRNLILLHHFIPISDETGITLVGTYNAASAANPQVPYKWRFYAAIPGEAMRLGRTGRLTEPELGSRLEHQALSYIGSHPLAPLAVAFHNSLRLLELEGSFAWKASARAQGLTEGQARAGVFAFWVLAALAAVGCFTAALRAAPRWVWWMPLLLALTVVLVNVETPRFRAAVDVFLILPAACAVQALLRRTPVVGQRGAPGAAGRTELIDVVEREA